MEERTKKLSMVGIIVVCLVAASTVTWSTLRGNRYGFDTIPDDRMTWLKCRNPACQYEYQVPVKEYYNDRGDAMRKMLRSDTTGMEFTPALTCPKCGQESVYEAVKCPNCELVFEKGSVPRDFEDRCPKCGYSQIEENRKKAAEARQHTENEMGE